MPTFSLRTINNSFATHVTLTDRADADDVLATGVRGAMLIAADEIHDGATAAVVEVIVEDADGRQVRRSAVSIAVASLAVAPVDERPLPEGVNDL